MTLGIMQPYFFPYIGYWQLIGAVDKFIILDDVTFIKQGYINRNRILSKSMEVQPIQLQIQGISTNKLICEHYLVPTTIWKNKLLKTLHLNYAKAPYFESTYSLIKSCLLHDSNNLSEFLTYQIRALVDFMGLQTEIDRSSEKYPNSDMKGQERIIDVCNQNGANTYVNAIGGQKLYDHSSFSSRNMRLQFLQTDPTITYSQFNDSFTPNLSIIDILMFNSQQKVHNLLNQYHLIS